MLDLLGELVIGLSIGRDEGDLLVSKILVGDFVCLVEIGLIVGRMIGQLVRSVVCVLLNFLLMLTLLLSRLSDCVVLVEVIVVFLVVKFGTDAWQVIAGNVHDLLTVQLVDSTLDHVGVLV